VFGLLKKKRPARERPRRFPPVPDWKPSMEQPLDQIVDRVRYYTNGEQDFAVFQNGTVAILPRGLAESDAILHAENALHDVFYAHPDMHPLNMDDGNIVVRYNHDVLTVVLQDVVSRYWSEIERAHQRALAADEVLITPMGPNEFDAFGMKALFGRCFMFMDAQAPKVLRIERTVA
jgi:hypothetical protein